MQGFRKTTSERGAAWEEAGLRWLADAGAVPVVEVLDREGAQLTLEHISPVAPTPAAAERLGSSLAQLHRAGAAGWGAPPPGWRGDGLLGPSSDLLSLPLAHEATWGQSYAAQLEGLSRVADARAAWSADDAAAVARLCTRLRAGILDDDAAPARVHGDLWSGNVLWSQRGAVLIDPAAHGAHPFLDIALLALFGSPYIDRVLAAYAEEARLARGWDRALGLHQVLHLLVHVVCFGGSYRNVLDEALRPWL